MIAVRYNDHPLGLRCLFKGNITKEAALRLLPHQEQDRAGRDLCNVVIEGVVQKAEVRSSCKAAEGIRMMPPLGGIEVEKLG